MKTYFNKEETKKRKVSGIKGVWKKLDNLWTANIKNKDGNKCIYCGNTQRLNAHHIYSRKNLSTRWDLTNGVCLCYNHHNESSDFSAHKTPLEFSEFLKGYLGESYLDELRARRNSTNKPDYDAIEESLRLFSKL